MLSELGTSLQNHLGAGYTVERELFGGMSRVFVALDQRLERRVAVKLLMPSLVATMSVERFNREIMMSAGLQHPNIVPVLQAGELEHLPYFVMPFIAGDSLRVRIARGPLSVRETVNVMRDVARALAYAHGHGVVHRDVKPDNILLAAGSAVVTDFGVAKALSVSRERGVDTKAQPITEIGFSLGTPAYMAPEQAAADPNLDHRADLYALGIVAYEMLVGTPPFHGRTPQAILAAHISEPPPPITLRRYDVPAALYELIMQCLQKDPARRPRSATEIARALEAPAMVSGKFATPIVVSRRRPRRLVMLGAAAGLALIAATAMVVSLRTTAVSSPLPANAIIGAVSNRSVAIFPFVAAGGGQRETGIATGITSELTNAVSGIAGLRVASQTSAASAAAARGISPNAAVAGVGMLVEGTVQTSGDRLRVTVRLVSVINDSTLWVNHYEGAVSDAFALQDAVSRGVVAAVAARAGDPSRDR
jgi:serine/threonine-protein kinase